MAHNLSEPVRKEIFSALVEAQDQEMPVAESKRAIARRFGISDEVLRAIEREGLDNDWPPLEDSGQDKND
jgi:hypothetical protein